MREYEFTYFNGYDLVKMIIVSTDMQQAIYQMTVVPINSVLKIELLPDQQP